MTDEELQEMIDEADRDGDGEVNEEELLFLINRYLLSGSHAVFVAMYFHIKQA